ncbi:hypothetical protein [Roseibacillus ishigakijimensis]|uniref:Verru_Chthon cassette protein A n=1 Tax=Roseibacillus ishigakijimensis TaxID=454146 RepID=A0A934RVQ1_9BACT|nr:hypothetical protein [Roseibacillus ishigakijimensis]MBK1835326.1 hypothetical protein [Roseibacillus ishigakijimensis]
MPISIRESRGFSLVVTVTLMILLSLIAVGLLSLSSTVVRSSQAGTHQEVARANARLALQLAIGALQKHAGSDTRVTASANLLESDFPPVLGVWKSWEGSDHVTSGALAGRPIAPAYESKGQLADSGDGRFLRWLVSSARDSSRPDEVRQFASSSPREGAVPLLGTGTLGEHSGKEVYLEPTSLNENSGALAWWVSGENQKARLPEPYEPEEGGAAQWSVLARSHAEADPGVFELDDLLEDASPVRKTVSLPSLDLLREGSQSPAGRHFHDLSVSSRGLLTNVATGGWRKDLSLFTERWDNLPRNNVPVFQVTPERALTMERPQSRAVQASRSLLYPWSGYRGGLGSAPIYQHGAVASWHHLKDWMTFYQNVSTDASGVPMVVNRSYDIANTQTAFQFLHQVRVAPVIARMHWVFSHYSKPAAEETSTGTHELHLLVNPVITMWNPYNVTLRASTLQFRLERNLPAAFSYQIGRADRRYRSLLAGSESKGFSGMSTHSRMVCTIRRPFLLGPGESVVFSAASSQPVLTARTSELELAPGYQPSGGLLFPVKEVGGNVATVRASDPIRVNTRFDTPYNDISEGVGIYLDMGPANSNERYLAYRMVYSREMAREVYPDKTADEFTQPTVGEVDGNPVPFLSTVFGTRLASESHLPARGFLQSSPLVNYTAMGSKSVVETDIAFEYPGVLHPVNSPFDYSFIVHAPGDSRLPNSSAEANEGYIVSGFDKSTGLSRVIAAELPLRPLCSLAELQNWDLRYENPIPPYQFNLIGNSNATPLLPPNDVVNRRAPSGGQNLQHDDAYCANHLLFDDWFLSSIATRPADFGRGGESAQEVVEKFLAGEQPLDNRAYRAVRSGGDRDEEGLGQVITSDEGWQKVAAHLEVEGMFNVNSVSVVAWRALLGHARGHRVPYLAPSANGSAVTLSGETDFAFSRFPVAGDTEAGTPGYSGAFPESSEFTGYRRFEEGMLDGLAEEIVEQVRLRGPFLSLSEFVNRQLSSGDLALAGAVQTALDELGEGGGGLYGTLAALSRDAGSAQLPEAQRAAYAFPEAAEGESAFGLPGWTRQADVLRAIAPILSVRDDTFTIRAYGDSRDRNGRIVATATCEGLVRRQREFLDASEDFARTGAPEVEANRQFGRRFSLVAFRWLKDSEV